MYLYTGPVSKVRRAGRSTSELSALDPPDDAQSINDDLVAATEAFAAQVRKTRRAAASGNAQDFQLAAVELVRASTQFNQELADIQAEAADAGIPIEPAETPEE